MPKTAVDAITNTTTTLEPIPSNLANAGAYGFGRGAVRQTGG